MRASNRPLRIAFARISQESNAFSPLPSTLADFAGFHDVDGEALLQRCARGGREVPDFLKNAELSGFLRACAEAGDVEPVPLFSVWAVPSGPLTLDSFEALRARLVDGLRSAGALDAVYLCLHGAMCVSGMPEPEAELLRATREVVGAIPIAASLDLHAILTPGLVAGADLIVSYRTNPHRDHADTGRRAGRLVIRTARGEVKPVMTWRSLPLALAGGTTIDFLAPMRSIYRAMKVMERDPRVLNASIFQSHLWSDHPEMGWATLVVTDNEPALGEAHAESLADLLWEVRHTPSVTFPGADEAIDQARSAALARRLGMVCMSDASDIVGAGAPGEGTRLLSALLARAADLRTYATIRDGEVVRALWDAPVGRKVELTVGGRLDPVGNPPLGIEARVLGRDELVPVGRRVLLGVGNLSLVVCDGPPIAIKPTFYSRLGLSVRRADIVMVKSFFPFRIYFAAWNRRTIYAKTQGVTDFDRLYDLDLARPTWPIEPVQEWRPTDRARRGVA